MAKHGMKMAKADQDDLESLRRFFLLLEAIKAGIHHMNDDDPDYQHLKRFISEGDEFNYEAFFEYWINIIDYKWRRVVWGCEILINNTCDPKLDYLEWRPDIKEWLESQPEDEDNTRI